MSKTDLTPRNMMPLFILSVLQTHGKADGLSQKEIEEYLLEDFEVALDRHAVKRNLDMLAEKAARHNQLGFKLKSRVSGDSKGAAKEVRWSLEMPESAFDTSEIRYLVDIVQAFEMIDDSQRLHLIEKLVDLSDEEFIVPQVMRGLSENVVNHELFYSVDVIAEALEIGVGIEFNYGSYGTDKKFHLNIDADDVATPKLYRMWPHQMFVSKGHYYLIGNYFGSDKTYHLRVDRMRNAALVDDANDDCGSSMKKPINPKKYTSIHSYMHSGEPELVKFRIQRNAVQHVFDQFGSEVAFSKKNAKTVDVSVRTSPNDIVFWALQFANCVEILEPASVRDKVADEIVRLCKKYKVEGM